MKSAVLTACLLALLSGQAPAQLTQIAMDASGKVMAIDAKIESRIHLFPECRDFRLARLFAGKDSAFVLETECGREGAVMREQKHISGVEVERLRAEIGARLLREAPEYVIDQEGRTKYLIGMSGVSLGFYSWSLPWALGAEDAGAVGMSLVSAGAGFFIPYLWSYDTRMTDGMATLGLQGAYRGILDGLMLANLLEDDPDDRTVIATGLVFSVAESVAGLHIAGAGNMSGGSAEAVCAGGNLGFLIGIGSAMATDQFSGSGGPFESQSAVAQMLGFSALGYAAGAYMAGDSRYTGGDADVLLTAGVLGAAAPVMALVVAGATDERVFGAVGALGCAAGMTFGHLHLRSRDYSSSQGRLTQLGTAAGGLLGMGVGYLLAPDAKPEKMVAGMAAAGGLLGFGLMLSGFDDETRAAAASGSWTLSFTPAALTGALLPRVSRAERPLHFLHLRGSF